MTTPLPPADTAYERDVDRAYHVYGKAILAALGPYTREKNLRKAMDTFNAAIREQDVEATFRRAIAAAQEALRERYATRGPVRYHPDDAGLPDVRAADAVQHDAEEEDW